MTKTQPRASDLIDFESALRVCRGVLSRIEPLSFPLEQRLREDFEGATALA